MYVWCLISYNADSSHYILIFFKYQYCTSVGVGRISGRAPVNKGDDSSGLAVSKHAASLVGFVTPPDSGARRKYMYMYPQLSITSYLTPPFSLEMHLSVATVLW
jgi:hypothetical protein